MEVREMTMADIEKRSLEIEEELKNEDADVEKLEAEVEELAERKEEIETEAETKEEEVRSVLKETEEIKIEKEEVRRKMDVKELRNSKEYVDAYANYIKTNSDAECRALLSENATDGTVPVPEFVYDVVRTAWNRDGIMALVRKSYLKGNLKVGFEISGDDAVIHTEGGAAIDPENLVLGTVNLTPVSIKKVIQISDEVYGLRGEDFLRYIYDELAYKIAKKEADLLISLIDDAAASSSASGVGVPVLTEATIGQGTIASAMALLSDEAANPVVIMNKATWGEFKRAQYAGNFNADIFEGLTVLFNNSITTYSQASSGEMYAIVGDLGVGALANYPDGEDIEFKFDNLTLKKQDLIEVLGRRFVAIGLVAPDSFVKIAK